MRSDASTGRERRLPRWERAHVLRAGCLLLIVVQNSSLIMVTSYSRTLLPPYAPTVAVFFAEVLKMGAALALLACEKRSLRSAMRQAAGLAAEHGWATLQFAVPALCYTLQNNLQFVAASHLGAELLQLLYQTKTLSTAIFGVIILSKSLRCNQWCALSVLVAGVVLAQSSQKGGGGYSKGSSMVGVLAALGVSVCSGFASVYLEKILKGDKTSIWVRNVQLCLFSIPLQVTPHMHRHATHA